MDIFEEIKEAVIIATPGEETRNYYRNQGMAIERERIIKLLEENFARFDASNNQVDYMSLTEFIELIKGETNE